ncbi:flagellar hook-basal body complex protein FliE [Clostridium aestuarii]|uniref:Flagellar hook-basal body complex protein FliE n=1 Tax=Clostridium aestuarii TaxID=338193 RepID=A0ABT4CXF3_9CLOT|nr:flagellar hook-basal body complex protein FliE [Clostridium aestuarii]MCY6483679.1 flagellar hook-basal body complex protein FliE [Clostridium aestuarii]
MKINGFIPNTKIYSKNETKEKSKLSNGSGFANVLKEKLDEVNNKQLTAEKTTEAFVKGEDVDIHEVMVKTAEADMALKLTVQIRNKLVEGYQELNRMQV